MTQDELELDTDYLLVAAATHLLSVLARYAPLQLGSSRPLSAFDRPGNVRRVMEIAKLVSLGGFFLSIIAVSSTVNSSFVVDRPIQTCIPGFLFAGGVVIALHLALKSLFDTSNPSQYGIDVQLKEIHHTPGRRGSNTEVTAEASSPSPRIQRLIFCLTTTAVCARVEVFRQTLDHRQCTAPGIEGLLPFLIAIHEYRSKKAAHGQGSGLKQEGDGFPTSKTWMGDFMSHVGPAALIAISNILASRIGATPRSTYICPTAMHSRQWTIWLQWLGLLLDYFILTSIGTLLSKRRTAGLPKPGRAPVILSSVLILSAFTISIFGAIACIIRPQYRARMRNIDGAYLGSFAWMTMLFTLSMFFALRLLTSGNLLDLTMIVSFTCTYVIGFSTSWAGRVSFPAASQFSVVMSLVLLFIGIVLYLRFNTTSESTSTNTSLRLFPRTPSSIYAVLLVMFLLRVFLDITPSTIFDSHPIDFLMSEAAQNHKLWLSKASESGTLAQAVVEYHRRYRRHPPPNFDKWYEYAKERSSLVIDDFETIFQDLLPFWAFDPQHLRKRTHEMLSDPWNEVAEVRIRSGKAEIGEKMPPTHRWMVEGAIAMTANFIEWLPDMDIALNINDESRIAVPYQNIRKYKHLGLAAGNQGTKKDNFWSSNRAESWIPNDVASGKPSQFEDHSFTNTFYNYGTISCPPFSPARTRHIWDPRTLCTSCFSPHSIGPFVRNWTLAASPCHQPDLANLHGFYLSPASFKSSHELMPVFSQSKAHGYADILYPSPWNYMEKVKYDPSPDTDDSENSHTDPPFVEKQNTLFWRGATSEGLSTVGTWKGMTRQRLVHLANNHTATVPILLPDGSKSYPRSYKYQYLSPKDMSLHPDLSNVTLDISIVDHIARCGDTDCPIEEAEFGVVPPSEFQEHWRYKYLMDMDGAGFSGRFLPFLRSRSLVFKTALFREWYDSRVTAWKHFVPIDLRLHGLWSTLAYFAGEPRDGERSGGKLTKAEEIAEQSRDWAAKVLRKEDMEIYLFRLLLEWGRLTDDARDSIGFEL